MDSFINATISVLAIFGLFSLIAIVIGKIYNAFKSRKETKKEKALDRIKANPAAYDFLKDSIALGVNYEVSYITGNCDISENFIICSIEKNSMDSKIFVGIDNPPAGVSPTVIYDDLTYSPFNNPGVKLKILELFKKSDRYLEFKNRVNSTQQDVLSASKSFRDLPETILLEEDSIQVTDTKQLTL